MSEPPSVTLGRQSTQRSPAAERPGSADALKQLPPGARVDVLAARLVSRDTLEAQLRIGQGQGSSVVSARAQLATSLSPQLTQQLSSASSSAIKLQAEVVSSAPMLVLRLLSEQATASAPGQTSVRPAASEREWLSGQVRQHWPASRPLAATLTGLAEQMSHLDAAPTTPASTARTATVQALQALLGSLASPQELGQPDGLARALARSGTWLEATVAQSVTNPALARDLDQDLKAQLLSMARHLRSATELQTQLARQGSDATRRGGTGALAGEAGAAHDASAAKLAPDAMRSLSEALHARPGESSQAPRKAAGTEGQPTDRAGAATGGLTRDVDGMIKQIVTNQLQSLSASANAQHWLLEVPFRSPGGLLTLDADIERDRRSGDADEETWSMTIRLDLVKLGPLTLKLSLCGERLTASLQSSSELGADTLKRGLGALRERLEARDIEVASIHAGHRVPDKRQPPVDTPLVSERA